MALEIFKESFFVMGDDCPYSCYMKDTMSCKYLGQEITFLVSDVDHFEADGDYTKAFISDIKLVYTLDTTIGETSRGLAGNHFDQCHKSSIANFHRTLRVDKGIKPNYVTFNNCIMNISRHEKARFINVCSLYRQLKGVVRRK
jgi:DNA-binding LytR/AlgR family response regulator